MLKFTPMPPAIRHPARPGLRLPRFVPAALAVLGASLGWLPTGRAQQQAAPPPAPAAASSPAPASSPAAVPAAATPTPAANTTPVPSRRALPRRPASRGPREPRPSRRTDPGQARGHPQPGRTPGSHQPVAGQLHPAAGRGRPRPRARHARGLAGAPRPRGHAPAQAGSARRARRGRSAGGRLPARTRWTGASATCVSARSPATTSATSTGRSRLSPTRVRPP